MFEHSVKRVRKNRTIILIIVITYLLLHILNPPRIEPIHESCLWTDNIIRRLSNKHICKLWFYKQAALSSNNRLS